jgi:amino acid adenylation domain-containing protein
LSEPELLHTGLAEWAKRQPTALAVECGDDRLSYSELESASRQLAKRLAQNGLQGGDRVGLLLPKSVQSVVSMCAVLAAGGAYVPVDEQSPAARQLSVLRDCGVRGLVATRSALMRLLDADLKFAHALRFVFCSEPLELPCACLPWTTDRGTGDTALPRVDPGRPAYVLYTSGSTGKPKGVVVSHRGARSFVDWAIQSFELGSSDHLANHAQLNFDLSVLDVFAALTSGARVQLIPPRLLLRPYQVSELMLERGVTVSYSVPSTLTLLAREGRLGELAPPRLTRVLFAGEVFPVPALRQVMQALPHARFFNLFGPTETNVCTWHALSAVPAPDAQAIPIGRPCSHVRATILDETGHPVPEGEPGELCVAGPPVLLEYFGRADLTRAAFWEPGPRGDTSGSWGGGIGK